MCKVVNAQYILTNVIKGHFVTVWLLPIRSSMIAADSCFCNIALNMFWLASIYWQLFAFLKIWYLIDISSIVTWHTLHYTPSVWRTSYNFFSVVKQEVSVSKLTLSASSHITCTVLLGYRIKSINYNLDF